MKTEGKEYELRGGKKIAEMLGLRKRGGKYKTLWGYKTEVGLYRTLWSSVFCVHEQEVSNENHI